MIEIKAKAKRQNHSDGLAAVLAVAFAKEQRRTQIYLPIAMQMGAQLLVRSFSSCACSYIGNSERGQQFILRFKMPWKQQRKFSVQFQVVPQDIGGVRPDTLRAVRCEQAHDRSIKPFPEAVVSECKIALDRIACVIKPASEIYGIKRMVAARIVYLNQFCVFIQA